MIGPTVAHFLRPWSTLVTLVYPGLPWFFLVYLFYLMFPCISNIDLNYFKTEIIKIACYGLIRLKTGLQYKL